MVRRLTYLSVFVFMISAVAFGAAIPLGFVDYTIANPTTGEFNIVNQTGPNSSPFPDPSFPVTTSVNLSSLSLTVDFSDGSTIVFGPGYFTLAGDGLSYDGGPIGIGGTNPQPIDATLTGTLSPTTLVENDGSVHNVDSSFSSTILPSSPPNLSDGDLAIINANESGSTVPEPGSGMLLGTAFLGFLAIWNRPRFGKRG